jgi:predicted Ser/Thr protein kinase
MGASLPRPGEVVGPCVVLRELARGGMGAVYVAQDSTGREVALKVLLPGATDERFDVEARALGSLNHPGVVAVHAHGQDPSGRSYLIMELIQGESLEKTLPLPPERAVELTLQAAEALVHAHSRGVLHRDLKPQNLIVTPEGRCVVADFGVARISDLTQELTRTGEVLGTPAYMPPEQATGKRSLVGVGSDVYGLGATLYALLAGHPPFQGATLINVLHAVISTPAKPPGIDASLDAIVMRALAKDPSHRHASMSELADELRAWTAGEVQTPEPVARRLGLAGLALATVGGLAAFAPWGEAPAPTPSRAPSQPRQPRPSGTPALPKLSPHVLVPPGEGKVHATFHGEFIFALREQGELRAFDRYTGERVAPFPLDVPPASELPRVLAGRGNVLALLYRDYAQVWLDGAWKKIELAGEIDRRYVSVLPGGRLAVTRGGKRTLVVFDLSTGLELRAYPGESKLSGLAATRTHLLLAREDGLWVYEGPQGIGERIRSGLVHRVAISPEGDLVAFGGQSRRVEVIRFGSWRQAHALGRAGGALVPDALAWLGDHLLVAHFQTAIRSVWKFPGGEPASGPRWLTDLKVSAAQLSPGGRGILVVSNSREKEKAVGSLHYGPVPKSWR